MKGFKYRGQHSSDMNVFYIPDALTRGSFQSEYDIIDSERAWQSGGEYFKARVKTKEFKLDCFYDQITYEQREKIIRWLDRRTYGELIFDERPWAAYFVRPTKFIEFKDYNQNSHSEELFSGTFTITFSAYDPFARLLYLEDIDGQDPHAVIETGILPASFTPDTVSVSDTDFLVYNPGTELGHSVIRFAGSTGSSDFTIFNSTTGDKFTLRSGLTTDTGEYYEAFSKTGRVEKVTSLGERVLDFAFHNDGYLTFAPCFPIYRDTLVQTSTGSKIITSSKETFSLDMVGKYIFVDGKWRYIGKVNSETEAELNTTVSNTGTETTNIVTMNYLTITKASDATITKLEVECLPEVR